MSGTVEAQLRGERAFASGPGGIPWRTILVVVGLFGALSGAAIGSFSWRGEQSFYSALKLPILIAASTAMCAPSFYAFNAVLGLREEFSAALRGVLCAQATIAVVLASLAPIVLLYYASTRSYPAAVFVDGLAFLAASIAGQIALARHYEPLIERNRRHRYARAAWLGLYWFVTIQLAWVLRPFVGSPGMQPTFFREDAWSNAYVALAKGLFGPTFGGMFGGEY